VELAKISDALPVSSVGLAWVPFLSDADAGAARGVTTSLPRGWVWLGHMKYEQESDLPKLKILAARARSAGALGVVVDVVDFRGNGDNDDYRMGLGRALSALRAPVAAFDYPQTIFMIGEDEEP